MHAMQKTFKRPNPRFNLFYLESAEHYFFKYTARCFTSPNNPYYLQHFNRIEGDLHFSTHSISWDPSDIKSPVLRFSFYEPFIYSIKKFSEVMKSNDELADLSLIHI
eukprot:TRINITY_DN12211_c0_g1_i3.p1 TRINITY_DN12211_c0_g1~~TRINITY_DN12211_c0_g1_i3.p1  ORF type:complete len:107 (-),score=2.18 TRINITY_DN12211_c0_g1_i3:9-329(-)